MSPTTTSRCGRDALLPGCRPDVSMLPATLPAEEEPNPASPFGRPFFFSTKFPKSRALLKSFSASRGLAGLLGEKTRRPFALVVGASLPPRFHSVRAPLPSCRL